MPKGNPVYLTTDANGNVGANFTGKISALGIDILAGDSATPPADRKIRWHQTTLNGPVIAEVFTYQTAALSQYYQNTIFGVNQALNVSTATATLGRQFTYVGAPSGTGANAATYVDADITSNVSTLRAQLRGANTFDPTIANSNGKSRFVQWTDDTRQVTLNGGSNQVTWPGGSDTSNAILINHGLGGLPAFAHANSTGVTYVCSVGLSATQISVQMRTPDGSTPAAASTNFFYWSATRVV